mmetsp:Transcript_36319/g.94477  ORF Transcript_36319/g.94477 Transcript_36319/m.94477 type:complete len:111 (+) Transcript_36319:186-518(+)
MFSGVPPFGLLTALTLQNALLVLLVRKSKMGEPYIASVAVVVAEVLKFFICLASLFYSKGYSSTITAFNLRPWGVRARIAVPALIYGKLRYSVYELYKLFLQPSTRSHSL